jgi:hypothetical protein
MRKWSFHFVKQIGTKPDRTILIVFRRLSDLGGGIRMKLG